VKLNRTRLADATPRANKCEKLSPRSLPITALILAGGMGTRLRAIVSDRPKPMALVHGVPFIEILIDSLAEKGIREIVLLVGYMGDFIEEYFTGLSNINSRIRVSHEQTPLGTGGAVKKAENLATDPSLLINGDTFFDGDINRLIQLHSEKAADVTLSLLPVADASRYGSVTVTENGLIEGFHEKQERISGPGLINAGFSLISKNFISELPGDRAFSMEREIFPKLADSGRMCGLVSKRSFFDIGTPESYEDFKKFVREKGLRK
jgi:D-glycero-alpha-D-manno-heptose 1-phosphate guanylyltransferase